MIIFLVRNCSSHYYISANYFKIALCDLLSEHTLESLTIDTNTKNVIKKLNLVTFDIKVSNNEITSYQKLADNKALTDYLKPYLLPFKRFKL